MAAIHRIYNAEVFINGSFVHGGIVFQERFLACGPQVTGGNTNFGRGIAAGSDMYSDEGRAAGGNTNSDKGIDTGSDDDCRAEAYPRHGCRKKLQPPGGRRENCRSKSGGTVLKQRKAGLAGG